MVAGALGCLAWTGCENVPCTVDAGATLKGTVGVATDPITGGFALFKLEANANRCLRIILGSNGNANYGIAPSNGYAVVKAEITQNAADCEAQPPVGTQSPFPLDTLNPPTPPIIEATTGSGCFEAPLCDNGADYFSLGAVFKFQSSQSWVPATDSFSATQLIYETHEICN